MSNDQYKNKDTFLWAALDPTTMQRVHTPLEELEDSHIQNIALHLTTRHLPIEKDMYAVTRRYKQMLDLDILDRHILPELNKRGLEEVTEEIPYEK